MRTLLFLFSLLLCTACVKVDPPSDNGTHRLDIPSYFKKEAARLSQLKDLKVEKTILQNGKKESKILKINNWDQELNLLGRYNIHQAEIIEEYSEVKEYLDGGKFCLTYQTKNPKLGLKVVKIFFDAEQDLESIQLEQKANNQVYASSYKITYQPSIGYEIKKHQKVILFEEDQFEVEVRFLNEK